MKFLRIGICVLVVFSVLAHGGVEEWSRAVFEVGASLLFLVWAVRFFLRQEAQLVLPSLVPPLAAFALVALAQWIFRITVSAYATRTELALLLADILVLFLAAQAFRTLEDWRGFVWFAMGFGFLVSIFGILQHLTFNGKLYWFREMRYGGIPFGPYVNRNHFAAFAELILPLALVPLVTGKVRRERWTVVALFAVLPIGALFLSASRGGIISFLAELGVLALVLLLRRSGGKQLLAGGVVVLVALLMVAWLGVGEIIHRFSSLQTLEVKQEKRISMQRDTWRIFLDHPIIGTGLGTLQTAFPPYDSLYDGKIVNHTHDDYLEALSDTGILGGLCCAWFLVTLFASSFRNLRNLNNSFAATLHLSGLVACCGFLVHSFVDFNLHIPANALLFFLMAQLATEEIQQAPPGLPQASHHRRKRRNP